MTKSPNLAGKVRNLQVPPPLAFFLSDSKDQYKNLKVHFLADINFLSKNVLMSFSFPVSFTDFEDDRHHNYLTSSTMPI